MKIRRVEPELPTDFEEALGVVKVSEIRSLLVPKGMHGAVSALCKLLIYRNAWWEKLGWKPKKGEMIHAISPMFNRGERIRANKPDILSFPTSEVCDRFKDTFKDLIEEAKELL